MPGEYTMDVSEKGKAMGKQLVVNPPGWINHWVLPPESLGVSQQSAGGVNVVVSGNALVGTVAILLCYEHWKDIRIASEKNENCRM